MAASVVSISLDGGYVQILQARRKGKEMVIDAAVMESLAKAADAKEKADIVQEAWRGHEIKAREVTLIVPRSLWTVKMVTVPSTVKETVKQVMDLNIEQYLPFSMAESIWDWEILSQGPGEESKVLLMAMRKQDFEERMQILRMADLRLKGVEVSSVGLLNTVHFFYPDLSQQRVAFVDLQQGWVDVLVVDRGEMTFSRGIELPKGLEAVPTWVGEVRHTLIAYDQNHPLGKIEKVVVVGSQFMLNLLREKHFEEPIQRPYQALEMSFGGEEIPGRANMGAHAGPLLRQLDIAKEAFHLSNIQDRAVEPPKGLNAVPTWAWAGAGAAVVMMLAAGGMRLYAGQRASELEERKAKLSQLMKKPKPVLDAWDQFQNVIDSRPAGVWFDNLDSSQGRVTIQVKADTEEAAYEFLGNIKKKPGFEKADIQGLRPVPRPDGKTMWVFSLTVDTRRAKPKTTAQKGETAGQKDQEEE